MKRLLSKSILLLNQKNYESTAEDNFIVDNKILLKASVKSWQYTGNLFTYFCSIIELELRSNSEIFTINTRRNIFQYCILLFNGRAY